VNDSKFVRDVKKIIVSASALFRPQQTISAAMAALKDQQVLAPAIMRQCPPQVSNRLFDVLAKSCSIEDAKLQELSRMFSHCVQHPHPGPILSAWSETALTFWVFPPSDETWNAMHLFMLKTLRPRVYESSETRDAQREILMVVPLKLLMITPALFETWMDKFTYIIGMCAGCVCFAEYFGSQMLISMMRIQKGRKNTCNFPCQYHNDFSMLYAKLACKRETEERVRSRTLEIGARYSRSCRILRNHLCTRMRSAKMLDAKYARLSHTTWPAMIRASHTHGLKRLLLKSCTLLDLRFGIG
jgi:hypothetical protein